MAILDKRYKITLCYTDEIVFESDNKSEAINKLRELEGKEYSDYLDYHQSCAENYERPADFYPSYYIEVDDKFFSIEDYVLLERDENYN